MNVVQELLWKRDELKDRKKALLEESARIDADIMALDRAIRIWEPGHSPTTPTKSKTPRAPALDGLFANDNVNAMVLETLRDAAEPISTRECAIRIAGLKDIPADDPRMTAISNRVSTCLSNLAGKNRVERAAVEGKVIYWKVAA